MIKMAAGKDQRRKKAAGNAPMTAPSTDLIDSNDSNDLANDDGPSNKDLVRCFCGNDDDFREMLHAWHAYIYQLVYMYCKCSLLPWPCIYTYAPASGIL